MARKSFVKPLFGKAVKYQGQEELNPLEAEEDVWDYDSERLFPYPGKNGIQGDRYRGVYQIRFQTFVPGNSVRLRRRKNQPGG